MVMHAGVAQSGAGEGLGAGRGERKLPFRIDVVLERVREAVRPLPKAALFELADRGYVTPFEILVACIISVRTRDEVTLGAAERLFAAARLPRDVARMSEDEIDRLITPCTFHGVKARRIRRIAERVVREYGGEVPCDFERLLSFDGVGPKCAHLALGIACGEASGVGVDAHVHRVTNRWGYVRTARPEQTMDVLQEELPRQYRVRINAMLVPFGKHICTGSRPKCSECPVRAWCRQVGVERPR